MGNKRDGSQKVQRIISVCISFYQIKVKLIYDHLLMLTFHSDFDREGYFWNHKI